MRSNTRACQALTRANIRYPLSSSAGILPYMADDEPDRGLPGQGNSTPKPPYLNNIMDGEAAPASTGLTRLIRKMPTKARKSSGRTILERIDKRLKALNLTDNMASELATGSRDTLRSIRRNIAAGTQRGISTETVEKFAPALKTTVEWLLTETGPEEAGEDGHIDSSDILPPDLTPEADWIEVVGYVGAGAKANRYAVGQGGLERVPPPQGSTEKTVALQIMGDSLGELFDRWLVFYDDVPTSVTPEMVGKLCIVGLSEDSVLIKKIRRSRTLPGKYDLYSNTEPPIEGVEVLWASRVKNMVPR